MAQSAVPKESPQEIFIKCPTCQVNFPEREIAQHDCQHADICVETRHKETFSQLFSEVGAPQEIRPDPPSEDEDAPSTAENAMQDKMEILKSLEQNLKSQKRTNVRRGTLFVDYVEARKRYCWILGESKLKVVFIGEPAVDTGGPCREFLTGKPHLRYAEKFLCHHAFTLTQLNRLYLNQLKFQPIK